jgi:phosphoribosylformylglycinamidine cyclo-ligase
MSGPEEEGATYAQAGVDIVGEGKAIKGLVKALNFKRKGTGSPVDLGGHFTGLVELGDHYLSLCTDGVGSKIKIAEELQKWDTVGIDCMAMNVNDVICIGAEPIAFVDYLATEDPDPEILNQIGIGLNEGARLSNLTIIGGETSTIPEIVNGLDLAGTCLGYVKKGNEVTGESVEKGDLIIGFPSSGIHSNGYTLVRKIVEESDISYISPLDEVINRKEWKVKKKFPQYMSAVEEWASEEGSRIIGEILLTPTRIYVRDIIGLLKGLPEGSVHGMANITGGGIRNLARIKDSLGYSIDTPLKVPPVFRMIQILGSVEEKEMYQTFNMGIGFVVIIGPGYLSKAMELLEGTGARKIGRVVGGGGVKITTLGIEYSGYV